MDSAGAYPLMSCEQPIIEAHSLGVRFSDQRIFSDISLSIIPGRTVAITGRSGEGKSTLLYALAGLLDQCEGEVKIRGKNPYAMSTAEASTFRLENLGFVFQTADLVPELTLQENVALPTLLSGKSRKKSMLAALQLLEEMGIDRKTAQRRPGFVSGGQRQRAAIARALSNAPQVIFVDEPTGALDAQTTQTVLQLLVEETTRRGATLVAVTHDSEVANAMDRTLELREGALHEC